METVAQPTLIEKNLFPRKLSSQERQLINYLLPLQKKGLNGKVFLKSDYRYMAVQKFEALGVVEILKYETVQLDSNRKRIACTIKLTKAYNFLLNYKFAIKKIGYFSNLTSKTNPR